MFAEALQGWGCSAAAAQSGWAGEVCAGGSQAYSSGGVLCICEKLLFCLFRVLAEVFDVLGISHSTLQRFC